MFCLIWVTDDESTACACRTKKKNTQIAFTFLVVTLLDQANISAVKPEDSTEPKVLQAAGLMSSMSKSIQRQLYCQIHA